MTTKEHAELLDLVIGRAAKLREAGVLELGVGGLHLKLAPAADGEPVEDAPSDAEDDSNPWTDPATFGRTKGVPGKDPRRKET